MKVLTILPERQRLTPQQIREWGDGISGHALGGTGDSVGSNVVNIQHEPLSRQEGDRFSHCVVRSGLVP